ncbi:MAG: hypothetical protein RI917_659 [Actinomycetota bacterium]
MKKLIGALIASLLLSGAAATSPTYGITGDYLSNLSLTEGQWLVLAAEQSRDGIHSQLAIQPGSVEVGGKRGDWYMCSGIDDPTCSTTLALKDIIAWSMLPDCSATSNEICIESFKIGTTTSDLAAATYAAEADERYDFKGDPSKNLLDGRGVPVYTTGEMKNTLGTNQFAVMVRPTSFWDAKTKKFYLHSLEAEILPYVLSNSGNGACLFGLENQCARPAGFLNGTVVELTFRIPNTLGGWFSGRMKDPVISVTPYSSTANLVTIKSEPVEVAALGLVKEKASFTPIENMWVENNGRWQTNGGTATGANGWQENIFPFIENYRPQVNDTAIGTDLVWKMRTIDAGPGSGCLADKSQVLGIVTTNALGYDIGSPSFNGGYLEYKVAGLHYMPNGVDLVIGSYDLIMRSETARCLYGFTKAPVSATVNVLGTGDQNIATTIVSEKDGWLKLAAYGFTFSEKEIKVKLTQPFTKTITKFSGTTKSLSSKQKTEIKATVAKAKSNPKFICTGTYVNPSSKATALARARSACNYAKSLDKNHSYFAQAKQTSASSYDAKVMISSK